MLDRDFGRLLGLIVHDLRGPAATIQANLEYLDGAGGDDPEAAEAVADTKEAVSNLLRGVEYLACVGRSLSGDAHAAEGSRDLSTLVASVAHASGEPRVRAEIGTHEFSVRNAAVVEQILAVLIANSVQHAPHGPIVIRSSRDGASAVIDILDHGPALALDLRADAFTAAGQLRLKGRADGRYSRFAGLFVARVLCDSIGASLEASEDPRFRVRIGDAT